MIADGLVSSSSPAQNALAGEPGSTYCFSKDLDIPFRVKLEELEGMLVTEGVVPQDSNADMYVILELWADGRKLCASACSGRCKNKSNMTNRYIWHDVVTFPISVCDLPLDTLLCLTVWSSESTEPVGGTSVYVYSTIGQLKRGLRRLLLHTGKPADGVEPSSTPAKINEDTFSTRTDKIMLKYSLSQMRRIGWLDQLTFMEVNKQKRDCADNSEQLVLLIEFHKFQLPIYHVSLHSQVPHNYKTIPMTGLVTVRDPEMDLSESPCEVKANRIMKSRHLIVDPDLKPNAQQYEKLQVILRGSPLKGPTQENGHLLWQFRYFLRKNKIGFTKFMRCVDWSDTQEEAMASKLIPGWGGLVLEECLELLGTAFKRIDKVRSHAVERLDQESVDMLLTVLLQLVQSLRYEKDPLNCPLLEMLIQRASTHWELCSTFYWHCSVETDDASPEMAKMFRQVADKLVHRLEINQPVFQARLLKQEMMMKCLSSIQETSSAAGGREKRREKATDIVRTGGCGVTQVFQRRGSASHNANEPKDAKGALSSIGTKGFAIAKASIAHLYKVEENTHQEANQEEESAANPMISTPLFPDTEVTQMRHDDIYLFKSAKMPMAISFTRAEPSSDGDKKLSLMYKAGDDIRQDQLVLQLVTVMDKLLHRDGLDLKLTPYRCLATGLNDGIMEKVPNVTPLQDIFDDIHGHFRKYNFDENGEFQLTKDCLDNWMKSNAGYAVITFLLGIGDRHLENLLVTKDGRLLHIDFGFILGRDPKPFPPPLKLRKEMVDAMGGTESARFNEFKKLCCSAFNIIRKHSSLVINMLAMMTDASIPDLTPDIRATKNIYAKIQAVEDKLRLDLNDTEATNYFLEVINEAITSIFGKMGDWMHKKAVAFRS